MSHTQHTISRLLDRLDRLEKIITTCAFVVLIGAVFLDVLSREFTGVGLHWARQVGVYANIVVVMIGLGLASASASHLRPRFADNWLPVRWHAFLDRMQDALMAVFCSVVAFFALWATVESFQLGEVSALLPIYIWPILGVIPLAFFLVALRHLAYTLYPDLKPGDKVGASTGEKS